MLILKTLAMIAEEYGYSPRTFNNHRKKYEILRENIKRGLQCPKAQKMFYETLGYPPSVDKSDYENV